MPPLPCIPVVDGGEVICRRGPEDCAAETKFMVLVVVETIEGRGEVATTFSGILVAFGKNASNGPISMGSLGGGSIIKSWVLEAAAATARFVHVAAH